MPTTHHVKKRAINHSSARLDGRDRRTDGGFFAGLPTIDARLAEQLREDRCRTADDEREADRQIAAACRALKDRFAAVRGGRWEQEESAERGVRND